MLLELVVENYAVVERLRIGFHKGLHLLTGETGSGKSILVDALSLLYGGRASADMVRTGAEKARIAGIFEAPQTPAFLDLMETNGIEVEDGELLLEREVQSSGKSRAFLGSRPVTAALLRQLAPHLGDIHGQHDQQELFHADSQLDMLDAFCSPPLDEVASLYSQWRQCGLELAELDRGEQENLRLADLWRFQKTEIQQAGIKPGEDAELESERRVLANVTRLQENSSAAIELLYDAPAAALAQISQARKRIEELLRIDSSLSETLEALRPAEIAVEEASHSLRHYLGTLEADPRRLDHVEARLAEFDKLKRKYGSSLDEIIAFGSDVAAKLEAFQSTAERRAQLQKQLDDLAASYEKAATRLSRKRRDAAQTLEKSVRKELASLAMEGTDFRIDFSSAEWGPRGMDRIQFLISPNRGEELRPLDKIASGGELSRLALALKTCVMSASSESRRAQTLRTLVFDEVDTGIGGATAETVGRRLKKLAASHQLLCVTHLPQVAGFADHHYLVEKAEVNSRTHATVRELDAAERTREIGRMLSGQKTTTEALKQAEQLIKMASRP
ncbi:MAG: DNA repair protein RecN [Acidimicrobiia bacterium]|nr:DNA repair protein RecN [Acidimicrobiia bacterium]